MGAVLWISLRVTPLNNGGRGERLSFRSAVEKAEELISQFVEKDGNCSDVEITDLRLESDGTWILTWV